jgi:predicted transcriptional regulator
MARTTSVVRRKIQELIENGVLTERNIQSQRKCRKVVDPEQVLCLWNQGFPVAKISNTLDISVNQIYKVINELVNSVW